MRGIDQLRRKTSSSSQLMHRETPHRWYARGEEYKRYALGTTVLNLISS